MPQFSFRKPSVPRILFQISPACYQLFFAASLLVCLSQAALAQTELRLPANTRVALVGNGTGQRLSLDGHFETLLHLRTTDAPISVRNFCWPADEVGLQRRPGNYTKIDDPLKVYAPQHFICFFGMNESFGGNAPESIEQFKTRYRDYLDALSERFSTPTRETKTILVTPIAFEPTGNPLQPAGERENKDLAAYANAVRELGRERGDRVVDVFEETKTRFDEIPGAQYTINGMHLNEIGNKLLAELIDDQLFGDDSLSVDANHFKSLQEVVNDKAWLHQQDYRMLNGWYVYGGRRTWDTETFPGEFKKVRQMVSVRDQVIWQLAKDPEQEPNVDDSVTGEVFIPETMFGSRDDAFREMREPVTLEYPTPEESIEKMIVPDGLEVQLFASEREFLELANPTQLAFDDRGRLWVSCMVNYPQWLPGSSRPSDRLLILEDTDGDGKADKCQSFYDKLICPTGFEFYKDGVLVVDEPHILFLRDTDGDDVADEVTQLIDGIATEDTHHAMGAWEYSPGGRLHLLEGIAMSTTLETPWGPLRKSGASGSYVWDLESMRIRHFRTPGQYNPWCLVFDRYGNGIVGDGTNAQHHWTTALSGGEVTSRKSLDPIFDNEGIRPAAGNEILRSRHFPSDYHNQLIYACVINLHGMPSFELRDPEDSAAPSGKRTDDLLVSSDMFFRPVDPKIGPDGALWFGDWCNALIGHMQYSQRDPNRDHEHGRIYRLVNANSSLNPIVTQDGQTIEQLLDQLLAFETRTRYRARRALVGREQQQVLAAIDRWLAGHDNAEPKLEALWIQEAFHSVDLDLVANLLDSGSFQQRAAAVHVVANEWRFLTGNEQGRQSDAIDLSEDSPVIALLATAAEDAHPRVRTEVLRAASLMDHPASLSLALTGLGQRDDKWVSYVREHTMAALETHWRSELKTVDPKKEDSATSLLSADQRDYLKQYLLATGPGAEVYAPLKVLADVDAKRDDQLSELKKVVAAKRGRPAEGAKVFHRVCAACHQHGTLGKKFGPNLTGLGNRMNKEHVIRSIVWPNEEIAKGYETVMVLTVEGKSIGGFVLSENDDAITLGIADGKTKVIQQDDIELIKAMKNSSMPEGLTETIGPGEFLDLLAFLTGQWIATNPNLDFPLRKSGKLIEVSRDSMVQIPSHFPPEWNAEAEHLLSGEGIRKFDFAVHSPSQPQPDPAVVIRLAKPQTLIRGKITNRADKNYRNRTQNLTIWVSDSTEVQTVEEIKWREVWTTDVVESAWEFELPADTKTRYIKIGLKGLGTLNIDRTVFYGPVD